jgi:AAA ATPase domain
LAFPETLYGREREIDTLLASFDRVVANGALELVLVSGYSGIGKSSVVNELHKALVPPRGLFASGKFDQYKRDIPYATLGQAFQSLVRSLLLRIAIPLAKALRQVHERGLIHKDIKPANIQVDVASGGVWLTGFGIASRLPREPPGRYQAMLPTFISGWDATALKARVAFGVPDQETLEPPENVLERRTYADPFVSTHMYEYVSSAPAATISTSTMTGRAWPCHVVKMAVGTGRVRVVLITSPKMRGSASVAFCKQALLSAAWPLAVATSVTAAARAILKCIRPPTFGTVVRGNGTLDHLKVDHGHDLRPH